MTINITCDDNYELASTLPIECNNGTWTVEPKCEPARCKILPDPPLNGMVVVCTCLATFKWNSKQDAILGNSKQ